MKISILTPSFNAGRDIDDAIQSVITQDYNNWEHIIVDGGSTDETCEILQRYSHLKWTSEPDRGIYDAMNKAIDLSVGDWVYFLGADDRLRPGALKLIAKAIEDTDADVVYGDVWSTRFGGRHDGPFDAQKLFRKNICHQAIFFKKEIFQRTGPFNIRYKSHADWDHNFKWFLSRTIKHQYVDCIIADYADGGYSSTNPDELFAKDKRFHFIKYGWKTVPPDFLSQLCKQEFKSSTASATRKLAAVIFYTLTKFRSLV